MKKQWVVISAMIMFLIGCGESVKTVEYWNNHKEERAGFLKKCRNGELDKNSQACENARSSHQADPKNFLPY